MGRISKKTVFAGVAGTIGIVGITQMPGVQAAMEKMADGQSKSPLAETIASVAGQFVNDNNGVKTAGQVAAKYNYKVSSAQKAGVTVEKNHNNQDVVKVVPKSHAEQKTASSAASQTTVSQAPSSQLASSDETATSAFSSGNGSSNTTINSASGSDGVTSATSNTVLNASPATPAESAAIASVQPPAKPAGTIQVTIQDGDTLSAIAAMYGISVDDILATNPTMNLNILQIGEIIYLPTSSEAVNQDSSLASNSTTNSSTASLATDNTISDVANSSYTAAATTIGQSVVAVAEEIAQEASTQQMSAATFVSKVYAQVGISLPASTVMMEGYTTVNTDITTARPGDLLFWGTQGASYDVAISLGGNQYIGIDMTTGQITDTSFTTTNAPSFVGVVN